MVSRATKSSKSSVDPVKFTMGPEGVENLIGCFEQLPCCRDIAGALAQCRPRDHRLGEIVARTDALENPHCCLDMILGSSGRAGGETFAHQPTCPSLIMEVAGRPTGREHALDQGPGPRAVATAEIAFCKPDRTDRMGPARVRTLEPGEALTQLRDTLVSRPALIFP